MRSFSFGIRLPASIGTTTTKETSRYPIGALTSTVTLALAPYAESYEIFLISPSATSAGLSAYGNYVYRTVSSDIYLGAGMAKIIGGRNETQNVMLINLDNSY